MFLKALILLLLSTLYSCNNAVKYPSWYTAINNDNDRYTGRGISVTLEDAKKKAINDIAEQIIINISSKGSTAEHGNSYGNHYKLFDNTINFDVPSLSLENYSILHQERLSSGEFIIAIQVNKSDVYEDIKKDLDQVMHDIENRYKGSLNTDIINQRKVLVSIINFYLNIKNKVSVLHALKPERSSEFVPYLIKMEDYQNLLTKLLNKLTFYVESENVLYKNRLQEILRKNNIRTLNKPNNTDDNLLFITIKENTKTYNINNIFFANINISILLNDYNGKNLSSSNITETGQSVLSSEQAVDRAQKLAIEYLNNTKLEEILNLN